MARLQWKILGRHVCRTKLPLKKCLSQYGKWYEKCKNGIRKITRNPLSLSLSCWLTIFHQHFSINVSTPKISTKNEITLLVCRGCQAHKNRWRMALRDFGALRCGLKCSQNLSLNSRFTIMDKKVICMNKMFLTLLRSGNLTCWLSWTLFRTTPQPEKITKIIVCFGN